MAITLLQLRTWFVRHGDRGASVVEYALLLALIAVICLVAVNTIGAPTNSGLTEAGSSGFVGP
jgi:Flp pilus assembly pilin Flp